VSCFLSNEEIVHTRKGNRGAGKTSKGNTEEKVRKYTKIAREVLFDVNESVQELGLSSSEPRSFLPLLCHIESCVAKLIEECRGSSFFMKIEDNAEFKELLNIYHEIKYAYGLLKVLPKAQKPFFDMSVM
jgi:hypothetical protein